MVGEAGEGSRAGRRRRREQQRSGRESTFWAEHWKGVEVVGGGGGSNRGLEGTSCGEGRTPKQWRTATE